jgi:hypothetical protein
VLEAVAPLTRGVTLTDLTPPVRRVFLVRSGSAAMLRDALERLRTIDPLPELCLLGRHGDDLVTTRTWPGSCHLFLAASDTDYTWAALADRADVAAAIRGASHHGFLAGSPSAAGYDNVFENYSACGVATCFAAIAGTGLVGFDLRHDELRRASAALCEAIIAWTAVSVRTPTARRAS